MGEISPSMDSPHVVILPYPSQGHIKPMLMLADLLSRADFTISFVCTEHCHRRLIDESAALSRRCPRIKFLSIPDGLPPDHPRSGPSTIDLFSSLTNVSKPIFREMIAGMTHAPPTCVITDGLMSFANDVAAELGIPAISFRTDSAAATWTYFHLEKLIQDGEIPVLEERGDMDKFITCIPGLENILRRRDLPTICKLDPQGLVMQFFNSQTSQMKKASALILNTFEELESPTISRLHSIFPAVYAIGPLHLACKSTAPYPTPHSPSSSSGMLQFDQSCIEWLDSQPPKSVLYVSFGTMVVISRDELMEIWHGLINSEKPFLWAMRPDLVWDFKNGPGQVPEEVKMDAMERGRIVDWAPQEDVLAHNAVGGFLTHSGWNSTLESICAGKPMICRPNFVEQPMNSRWVSEVWKIGVDVKDVCDRSTVEKIVRELMEGRREEIVKTSSEYARLAQNSVRDGGSSHANVKKLIRDIELLHSNKVGLKVDN
ncbi:hypothetical protein ACS0TY_015865 [Phlomoides rotata]